MPQNVRLGDDPAAPPPEVRLVDGAIVGRSTAKAKAAAPPAPPASVAPDDEQDTLVLAPAPEEEEVLFRCEAAPDLTQYTPGGRVAQFRGQFFRTKDAALAAELRGLIRRPGITVLYVEEDIDPLLECDYCAFTSFSYKDLKSHIREQHKGSRIPPLRELV